MKVLVTGGTGFVGSHAVAGLLAAGHDVRVLAREPGKVARVLAPLGAAVTDVVAGDMTEAAAVDRALDGCAAVVHCAAEIGVTGGRPATSANIDGARLVIGGAVSREAGAGYGSGSSPSARSAHAAAGTAEVAAPRASAHVRAPPPRAPAPARVVYTSSVTVHLPSAGQVLTPDSPLAEPRTAYGAQKVAAERYVQELQAAGAPVTTLVVGGVYGPCSPHTDGSFAAILAALAAGMYAPGSGLGIVDVRDLAAIICCCAGLAADGGPRRYLVSGHYVTWREWAELLAQASGQPVPYHEASAADLIALGRKFDELRANGADLPPLSEEAAIIMSSGCPGDDTATLAELGLGYRPAIETFRDAVAWLRAAGHLSDTPRAGGART